jgi:uncharacterized protein (TIGR03437 family)
MIRPIHLSGVLLLALLLPLGLPGNDTFCDGELTGLHDNVVVLENALCTLHDANLTGGISVRRDGALVVSGLTFVAGNVQSDGGRSIEIAGSRVTVGGNLLIIHAAAISVFEPGTQIYGNFQYLQSSGFLTMSGVLVRGDFQFFNNTGGALLTGNTIRQNMQCSENVPPPEGGGNVAGSREGQCMALAEVAAGYPTLYIGGAVNAASFAATAPVSPGSIAAVFGTALDAAAEREIVLTMNAIPAPVFAASAGQINFQVPWELAGQPHASLTVWRNGIASDSITVPLAAQTPGLFAINASGRGQGAIAIGTTAVLAAPAGSVPGKESRPVRRGEYLAIYCTGLGPVTSEPPTGAVASADPLSFTTTVPTVILGGRPVPAAFAGLAPDSIGLYQVNVQVPQDALTGSAVPVSLTIGGVFSNSVTIAVE